MKPINPNIRGRFDGMLQILKFNSHLYWGGIGIAAISWLLLIEMKLKGYSRTLILSGSGLAIFWMVVSLLVSHWVYDRSEIYQWRWLADLFTDKPRRWINIHAGLDESSPALRSLFPNAIGMVLDIFNPATMTERSIEKARRKSQAKRGGVRANFAALPVGDADAEAIFVIFAAHELRRAAARARFFAELRRVLVPGGSLVMVEHLRDWKNFAAFGPGFVHFFSARDWRRTVDGAGLVIEREFGMTPFVRVFLLRRPS
jgi:hypothetical protein